MHAAVHKTAVDLSYTSPWLTSGQINPRLTRIAVILEKLAGPPASRQAFR